MFSSSLSERKSKSGVSGVRVVENDLLRSQDETLIHTFPHKVSIRIGNEAVDGFLSFTSERLLFSREDDTKEESTWKVFQIYFRSVCVHAIESLVVNASSEEEEKDEKKVGEKCLYLQVDGELDPLIVRNERGRSDDDEEDDSFEEPATEVRIFPLMTLEDKEGKEEEGRMVLEEMFERMNECATLNPDTDEDEENDENDDPMFFGADGMVTAETLSFLGEGRGGYFTSEKAIREAGFGEKLDEFERKLVINEEDRKRFEDAEE
jgi:hypothetical protein